MSLTGDDLPGDGAQQVICACMGESFKVIITLSEIVAECLGCGSTANRFPSLTGAGIFTGSERIIGPGRDTVSGSDGRPVRLTEDGVIWAGGGGGVSDWAGDGFSAGAGWGAGPGGAAQPMGEDEIRTAMEQPAPLPAFSPEMANVFLRGGPYDGQVTWLMPGLTEFLVSGMQGKYMPDPAGQLRDCEDGRRRPVMLFVPSIKP